MPRYNHMYTIAFEVVSEQEDGEDVTADMLREALERRIANLDGEGDLAWEEAVGAPDDTYRDETDDIEVDSRRGNLVWEEPEDPNQSSLFDELG